MDMTVIMLTSVFAILAFIAGFAIAGLKARGSQSEQLADLKQAKAEKERLEQAVGEKESEAKELSDALNTLRVTQERTEAERSNGVAQVEQLEGRLDESLREAVTLRKSEQNAREALVKIQEATDNLIQKEADKTQALNTLQEKFDQLTQDEKLARECSVKDSENAENLSQKLNEKSDQLQILQGKYDQLLKSEKEARETAATAKESVEKLTDQKTKDSQVQQERLNEKDERIKEVQSELTTLTGQKAETAQQLSESQQAVKKAEAQLEEVSKQSSDYKLWWEETKKELNELQQNHNQLTADYTELNTTLEQRERNFKEQFQQLEQSKETLTKEFERLANKVLEEKGRNFKELNKESLSSLLNPIQTEMKGFKEVVEKSHKTEAEQRIQLKTELRNLQDLNRDITDQAKKLTTALQGQKKVQGNWGELMLENVLDGSGLRIGTDYKREVSFTTEEGRQRPDAIVYLPQGKHMVIDAKTSLAAYTRYVNADDELERNQALKEHSTAVNDRINELADRNYFSLPGLNSPEIVVMFIPIESAYVEALKYDEALYQRAIERNVLVATPTTLLTSLNIVRQLWRFEDQNKHTAELAKRAEKFYNKLRTFLTSMQEVGKQLDKAKHTYTQALGQLDSGRGNLIKQAAEFKDLGVSVTKELPEEMVERASLELDQQSSQNTLN